MTTWYARVKTYGRIANESVYQRKIELKGWRDCVEFAALAIGGYTPLSKKEIAEYTKSQFKKRSQDNALDILGVLCAEEYVPSLDGLSAMLLGEDFYSGIATSKRTAILNYSEADGKNIIVKDEW